MAAENPTRVELRAQLADAHNNIAHAQLVRKHPEAAEPELRRAVELYSRLAEDYPELVSYRLRQAQSQGNLGELAFKASRDADAEAAFRRTIDLFAALVRDHPDQPDLRERLCSTYSSLAMTLDRTKRSRKALEFRKPQLAIAQALADEFPQDIKYHERLANTLVDQGTTLHALDRDEEAEAVVLRAVELYESLVKRSPSNQVPRSLLANSLNNLAQYIRGRPERLDEAEAHLRRSLEYRRGLAAELPDNLNFRRLLGESLSRLGQLRKIRGHAADACKLSEEAIPLLKSALLKARWDLLCKRSLESAYNDLAAARIALGDAAGAAAVAESLAHDLADSGQALAMAAGWMDSCVRVTQADLSATSEQRRERAHRYTERARELIEQALKRGPDDAKTQYALAFILVTASEPSLRDPSRAVALARRATTASPQAGWYWSTLALACLRAGNLDEAARAVNRAISLPATSKAGFDWLILASVLAKKGDVTAARQHYDRALEWRKNQTLSNEDNFNDLRSEAEALLGLKAP